MVCVIRADAIGATCGNYFENLRVIHVRWQRTQENVASDSENLICFWWLCTKMRLIFVTLLLCSFVFEAEVTFIMPYGACHFWGIVTIYASVLLCNRCSHAFAVVRTDIVVVDIPTTHSRLPIRMAFQWDRNRRTFRNQRQRQHQHQRQRHPLPRQMNRHQMVVMKMPLLLMMAVPAPRNDNDAPGDVGNANIAPEHARCRQRRKNRKYASVLTNLCVPPRWIQTPCAADIRSEF